MTDSLLPCWFNYSPLITFNSNIPLFKDICPKLSTRVGVSNPNFSPHIMVVVGIAISYEDKSIE